MYKHTKLSFFLIGVFTLVSSPALQATLINFDNITGNDLGNANIGENQLFVELLSAPGQITFTFQNVGPEASAISEIYFDNGTFLEF